MAKSELKILSQEIEFQMDKSRTEDIFVKTIKTDKETVIDARIYWYAKEDEGHNNPQHSSKGLWLKPDLALEVGLAMVGAAEKALGKDSSNIANDKINKLREFLKKEIELAGRADQIDEMEILEKVLWKLDN